MMVFRLGSAIVPDMPQTVGPSSVLSKPSLAPSTATHSLNGQGVRNLPPIRNMLPQAPVAVLVLEEAAIRVVALASLAILLQYLLMGAMAWMRHQGFYHRTLPSPTNFPAKMLMDYVIGYCGYMNPLCLFEAWLQPVWCLELPNLISAAYWGLWALVFIDTWIFFLHNWFHASKVVFKHIHAKHHSAAGDLDVNTFTISFCEGVLQGGVLPVLAIMAYNLNANFYFYAATFFAAYYIPFGHAGHDVKTDSLAQIAAYAICNPLSLVYLTTPTRCLPFDHEMHHKDPRVNMAPFFSFWDDIYGSAWSHPRHVRSSGLVILAHLAYQAAIFSSLNVWITSPSSALVAYLLAYVMVSPQMAAMAFGMLKIPEATNLVLGWMMDAYRHDNAISYAAPGTPGSFNSSASKDAVYLFACHPTGTISRSALLTFAAKGWSSPVSALGKVRMGVGSILLRLPIPLSREALLALGCVPADRQVLRQHLQSGTSIALTPGGWKEPTHTGSYQLLLRQRYGFVALARETGAKLVPVLCLGEHLLGTDSHTKHSPTHDPMTGNWFRRLLFSEKPGPVKVVFGQPIEPPEGEAVQQLHSRYVTALHGLAEQHGVKISIIGPTA